MNIKPLNYEFTHKRRIKPYYDEAPQNYSVPNQAGLCKSENNNKGYNVSFSSNQSESMVAAKTFMERIMNSGAFKWLTGFAGAHNVAAAALIGLFLAGGLRPAITISLPGKKDLEDKIYAAGHSMASGLIGFAFSTAVTTPIDTGSKYIYEDAKKISRTDYFKLSEEDLARYIRKNNLSVDGIVKAIKANELPGDKLLEFINTEDMSPEEIEKLLNKHHTSEAVLRENLKRFVNNDAYDYPKMAKYIKENYAIAQPVRQLGDNMFRIVSSKTDEINALKRRLSKVKGNLVEEGKIRSQIRNLENWVSGMDTTVKNVSEWVIAVPRAMLTIALIPPILKYVFHVGKSDNKNKSEKVQQAPANGVEKQSQYSSTSAKSVKSLNEFIGGNK